MTIHWKAVEQYFNWRRLFFFFFNFTQVVKSTGSDNEFAMIEEEFDEHHYQVPTQQLTT